MITTKQSKISSSFHLVTTTTRVSHESRLFLTDDFGNLYRADIDKLAVIFKGRAAH